MFYANMYDSMSLWLFVSKTNNWFNNEYSFKKSKTVNLGKQEAGIQIPKQIQNSKIQLNKWDFIVSLQ